MGRARPACRCRPRPTGDHRLLKTFGVTASALVLAATVSAVPAEARTVIIEKRGPMGSKTVVEKRGSMGESKTVIKKRID